MILLILGGMHGFNVYVFSRVRQRGVAGKTAPVAPDAILRVSPVSHP
jgi:hypothetical protein